MTFEQLKNLLWDDEIVAVLKSHFNEFIDEYVEDNKPRYNNGGVPWAKDHPSFKDEVLQ